MALSNGYPFRLDPEGGEEAIDCRRHGPSQSYWVQRVLDADEKTAGYGYGDTRSLAHERAVLLANAPRVVTLLRITRDHLLTLIDLPSLELMRTRHIDLVSTVSHALNDIGPIGVP